MLKALRGGTTFEKYQAQALSISKNSPLRLRLEMVNAEAYHSIA